MSELYDSVTRKRMELGMLQRTKTLSTILESQVRLLALMISSITILWITF